jgi:hypothetical protein
MQFQYDFYYFYAAGKLFIEGQDPYKTELIRQQMWAIGFSPEELPFGFLYPPYTLWCYTPFSLLPFALAQALWLLFTVLMLFAAIKLITSSNAKLSHFSSENIFLASLLYFPLAKMVLFGQLSFILLAGLEFFIYWKNKGKLFLSGCALSLLLIKPHVVLLFLIFNCILFIKERNWKIFAGIIFGFGLQTAASFMLAPQSFLDFYNSVKIHANSYSSLLTPSLGSILSAMTGIPMLSLAPLILSVLWMLLTFMFRPKSPLLNPRFIIALSLLSSPYCQSHEFILLIGSYLAFSLNIIERYSERVFLFFCIFQFFFFFPTILFPHYEFLTVIIPLLIAGLLIQRISLAN